MLELNINDNIYELASEWSDITLRQFIDIMVLRKDEGNSELDTFIKTLAIFAGDPTLEDEILDLDTGTFKQIQTAFAWIGIEPKAPEKEYSIFEFEGKKFSMKRDYSQLTVGEAITVETLMKDKSFDLEPLEISFAVLFREVDENGKLAEFNADTMFDMLNNYSKRIKLLDVYNVITFFLSKETISSPKNSKVSLSLVPKK
jgi:hypothetical protein